MTDKKTQTGEKKAVLRKNGRFAAGTAKPAGSGRQKGWTKAEKESAALLKTKRPEIIEQGIKLALEGKAPSLLLHLFKKYTRRIFTTGLEIPENASASEISRLILSNVGSLPNEELLDVSRLLQLHIQAVELADLEARLKELENRALQEDTF